MLSLAETRSYLRRARVHLERAKEIAESEVPAEVQATVLAASVEIHLRALENLELGFAPGAARIQAPAAAVHAG